MTHPTDTRDRDGDERAERSPVDAPTEATSPPSEPDPSSEEPTAGSTETPVEQSTPPATDGVEPSPDEGGIEDLGSDVVVDADRLDEVDEDHLLGGLDIETTEDIEVPERLPSSAATS
jgi:Lon-like ATP-dependent protease